jgi:ribosomal protein S17E
MGKIKTRLIKRTARAIDTEDIAFNSSFENNKKILADKMPSKKVRNQIAGYLTRVKKVEEEEKIKLEKALKKKN